MMECASREAMAEYELWNIRANSFRVRSCEQDNHTTNNTYIASCTLFVDYKKETKVKI